MYHKLTPVEAKKMMDTTDDIIILDVREPEELDEGYIDGAVNIPLGKIEDRAEKILPKEGKKILLYCRSGRRSLEAANKLCAMGYEHIYDFGGIISWPFEVVM